MTNMLYFLIGRIEKEMGKYPAKRKKTAANSNSIWLTVENPNFYYKKS